MQFNEESINKGKEISNIIKTKLDERGIKNSKNISDGITGNIYAENSNFISSQEEIGDINKLKDNQKGYGLFQFTDYKNKKGELVGHRTEYNKYLIKNNKEDNSDSQIDYVLDNIFTKGKGSGFDIGAGNKEMLKKKETQMMMANAQAKHAEKMASGELEYSGKLLESRQSDWKDEFVLIILTLPILILSYSVWSSDPEIMVKVDMFFEKFANLPNWFTNLWILVVASIYGIKGTQIFKGGIGKK